MAEKAGAIVAGGCKEIAPVLKNFQLEAHSENNRNMLRMMATDMDLSVISETYTVVVEQPGTVIVPARKLLDCLKESGEADITLTVDKDKCTVSTANTQWQIALGNTDEYPKIPTTSPERLQTISSEPFVKALRKVRNATATEDIRPELLLVRCSQEGVYASDGARMHCARFNTPFDFELTSGAVDQLIKIIKPAIDPEIRIAETPEKLLFVIGSDVFVATKSQHSFPMTGVRAIESSCAENQYELQVDANELLAAIKRGKITADEETNRIMLRLKENEMLVETKDKQGNAFVQKIQVHWTHPPMTFATNWQYLQQAINEMESSNVVIRFGADKGKRKAPLLIAENNFTSIINQLLVSDAGEAKPAKSAA